MTRRSLIRGAVLVVATAPAWLIGCVSRRATNGFPPPSWTPVPAPGPGPLSTAETEDLVAFGEVVVEGRALALAERRVLVEHVQDRAKRSPEYRSLCRAAASTLNGLVGRRFAALEISERIDLIARHGLAGRGVEPADDLDPSAKMRPLRTRIAPDLIRGYYASAAGWAVVGYQTFPGRCGELTRYTRPET